ncbi:MAG: Wzz/FepE/Etk N-terminal domain-containing protein [Ardenticatenaceae bacterium]
MAGTSIVTGSQTVLDQDEIQEIEAEVIDLETRLQELEQEIHSDKKPESTRFLKTTARFSLPTAKRNGTGKQERQLTRSHFYRRLLQSRIDSLERERNSLKVLNNELEQQIAYATSTNSVQVARPPQAPYQLAHPAPWQAQAQAPAKEGGDIDLKYYLEMLAKSWWLILLTAVVATVIALFASYAIAPTYQATARYLVSPTSTLSGTEAVYALETLKNRIIITTYAEVLNSRRIYESIGNSLEMDPEILVDYNIEPVVVPEASVLEVTAEGPNPEVVVLLADHAGKQTVDYLSGAYEAYDVELLDGALLPEVPIAPNPLQNASIAFIFGLLLGAGFALVRGYLASLSKSDLSLIGDTEANIYKRKEFEERLEEELKNNHSISLGLVELDSTNNVALSEVLVRELIQKMAKMLPTELRGKDVVGYWSSSCIAILMPSVPSMMAYSEFHYIQQVLSETLRAEPDTAKELTPHVGVVTQRRDESAETLIEQAESALQEARQSGKSVVLFSPHKALAHSGTQAVPSA